MLTKKYIEINCLFSQDKGVVAHLEKVCTCVLKGHWPKPPKLDTHPLVTKLPAFTRPLVSTVGHATRAELTNEKQASTRGGNIVSNRDFKIKSIDGLKLTVRTDDSLKRKKPTYGEQQQQQQQSRGGGGERICDEIFDAIKIPKKSRVENESNDPRRPVQVSSI